MLTHRLEVLVVWEFTSSIRPVDVGHGARMVDKTPNARVHQLPEPDRAALLRRCGRGPVLLLRPAGETVFEDAFTLLHDVEALAGACPG